MESIADSDQQAVEGVALGSRAERDGRIPGARPSGKVPWTAWVGFGSNWLSAEDSYWRRRLLILASGLVVLCLIAWGVSDLLGPARLGPAQLSPAQRAGNAAAAPAADGRLTLPSAAYGPPWTPPPGPASPAATPGASTPGTPSGSASSAPGQCPSASIVLSLFSPQQKYGPAQQPRFTVYVVSTAPGACQLSYLPPFAHVIVTRKGEVVWDSASCAAAGGPGSGTSGGAARRMPMTEGVPRVTTLSWDRKATSQGCAGSLRPGASGTFEVVAMAGGKSSPVAAITLTPQVSPSPSSSRVRPSASSPSSSSSPRALPSPSARRVTPSASRTAR